MPLSFGMASCSASSFAKSDANQSQRISRSPLRVLYPPESFFEPSSEFNKLHRFAEVVSLWERLLNKEGLAFVHGFPLGVEEEKLQEMGRHFGIDSAVESLIEEVPLDVLAPSEPRIRF